MHKTDENQTIENTSEIVNRCSLFFNQKRMKKAENITIDMKPYSLSVVQAHIKSHIDERAYCHSQLIILTYKSNSIVSPGFNFCFLSGFFFVFFLTVFSFFCAGFFFGVSLSTASSAFPNKSP